jgi:hypothetical protein
MRLRGGCRCSQQHNKGVTCKRKTAKGLRAGRLGVELRLVHRVPGARFVATFSPSLRSAHGVDYLVISPPGCLAQVFCFLRVGGRELRGVVGLREPGGMAYGFARSGSLTGHFSSQDMLAELGEIIGKWAVGGSR